MSSEPDRHTVQICLSAQDAHVTGRMNDRGNVHLSADDGTQLNKSLTNGQGRHLTRSGELQIKLSDFGLLSAPFFASIRGSPFRDKKRKESKMARTNKVNVSNSGEFKHRTSVGADGELLFDAPVVINDKADMDNFGITEDDCRYLHFGSSQKMRVYFFKTPNRAFAEYQWEYINNLHSSGYFSSRCMVPGERKAFVRCRDTNKCSECPYGRTPETKQATVVSLDGLIDTGWEPNTEESVENQAVVRKELAELRVRMDAEDPRIAAAFEAKELLGDSVKKIAEDLGVSEPRVYQLIKRAKEIGREYRLDN